MNYFAQPATGHGSWHTTYDFRAHYRRMAAEREELGERVLVCLYHMGENTYGAGYEYHRRICVLYRLREAAKPRPVPADRQMSLFGEAA